MKQHITKEQVYELDEDAYYRYLDYFKKKDSWVGSLVYLEPVEDEKFLPLMSIGQMIEFLQTYKTDNRYKNKYPKFINFHQIDDPDDKYPEWWSIQPDALCDDLWLAVKEVLNK